MGIYESPPVQCLLPLTSHHLLVSGADPEGQFSYGPHPVLPWTSHHQRKNILNLIFTNFCDCFVKKVVSEIRKCRQLL